MKRLTLFLTLVSFASIISAHSILKAGTQVPVELTSDASSKVKDGPTAIVAEDIFTSDGVLAIKRGTSVQLYYESDKARACGGPGHFTLRFETTRTVNNMKVALDCNNIKREGKNKHGVAVGLGCVGYICPPFLLFLLIRGQNVCIPSGTQIADVYVAEDVEIQN